MKIDLDPEALRTSISLWKDAIDMKMPIHDDFKIHFIKNRASLLEGFEKTAGSWLMILNACKQEPPQTELDKLKDEVNAFRKWAQDGLADIQSLKE